LSGSLSVQTISNSVSTSWTAASKEEAADSAPRRFFYLNREARCNQSLRCDFELDLPRLHETGWNA
jgi:hypothetical protein